MSPGQTVFLPVTFFISPDLIHSDTQTKEMKNHIKLYFFAKELTLMLEIF